MRYGGHDVCGTGYWRKKTRRLARLMRQKEREDE